jgi:small subunit ribosomal protein S1
MVKVIDIDLERRRISLSLKQANEGFVEGEEHFDPTLYGMAATYDEHGNYVYPDGFDPATAEWLPGYEKQREEWERQYAEARQRWEAHTKQVVSARQADATAEPAPAGAAAAAGATGSVSTSTPTATRAPEEPSGTLATDEALAALREKLAGGKS